MDISSTEENRSKRRLMVVSAAVIFSMALMGVGAYLAFHNDEDEADLSPFAWMLLTAEVPYAMILWRLTLDERKAAALAIGWAPLVFITSALLVPFFMFAYWEGEKTLIPIIVAVLVSLAQLALLAAVQVHRALPAIAGERSGLLFGFLQALGLFLLCFVVGALNMRPIESASLINSEPRAIRSLRRIARCAAEYASQHPERGFPANLSMLGPDGGRCLDVQLATGKKRRYSFVLTPGPVDASGIHRSYSVAARPLYYRDIGGRSFLLDETGAIRYTAEDRAATVADPRLQ